MNADDIKWENVSVSSLSAISISGAYYVLLTPEQVRAVLDLVRLARGWFNEIAGPDGPVTMGGSEKDLQDILDRLDMKGI